MRQVVSTTKGVQVIDVPSPEVQPGEVLVAVEYSFVSSGTELATLDVMKSQGSDLASYVAGNPSLVGRAAGLVRKQGVRKAASAVMSHIHTRGVAADRIEPLGYSCAGRVIQTGENVVNLHPGDRVACAGAGLATHSELVVVPDNLVSIIPPDCDMRSASSVAIGAIAMQAVRRSEVRLGERVLVIGLGLVGLITVQLLKLSGARVFGFDLDLARVQLAESLGAEAASSDAAEIEEAIHRSTGRQGVDVSIITASSHGSDAVALAMDVTRKRGRVVAVGVVGMDIQRDPFLRKEIDFVASSSYGPGRYDEKYEQHGIDYPYAFVRWTEQRNMDEYSRLVTTDAVSVASFTEEFPLESAPLAYKRLAEPDGPVAIALRYKKSVDTDGRNVRQVLVNEKIHSDRPSIAILGAGSFVTRIHLPTLEKLHDKIQIGAVVGRRGARVTQIANQYGANYASTSIDTVLNDGNIDAVLIGTRHNTHADLVIKSLKAGKHVFVEKPLAITDEELESITAIVDSTKNKVLMTGFNRRFSPAMIALEDALQNRETPLIMTYQMNVGYLSPDHWLRGLEGGGRNLGEACHVYDIFTYLTGAKIQDVYARAVTLKNNTHAQNENFSATLKFSDGSIGSLIFSSFGSASYPKEMLQVYVDETVYNLTDYSSLERVGAVQKILWSGEQDKGHSRQINEFVDAISLGNVPVPVWQQLQSTKIALAVENQLIRGSG